MIERNLNELLDRKERELRVLRDEMESIGGGKLNIRKKNGDYYFMEREGGEQRGISKDKERVNVLARKALLEERLKLYEQEIEILRDACVQIAEIDRSGVERVRDWLKPVGNYYFNYSESELEWIRNKQSKNPKKREYLRFATNGGVMTRSKSERYIGNFLEAKGVIYMYEDEIEKHPDFTILCPNGRIVIWEHCGMMDKVGYYLNTMVRKYEYRKIGYAQHDNLICTYDEDLNDARTLEKIYRRYIL